jgi:DNA-binding YbaB/EbfC family protein
LTHNKREEKEMFDKMKQLMEMQKKMQEMKRQLDATTFEVTSADGLVTVAMSGSQEAVRFTINKELAQVSKADLEKIIKDVYNKAVKRSQEIAASKMKEIAGLNLPGL